MSKKGGKEKGRGGFSAPCRRSGVSTRQYKSVVPCPLLVLSPGGLAPSFVLVITNKEPVHARGDFVSIAAFAGMFFRPFWVSSASPRSPRTGCCEVGIPEAVELERRTWMSSVWNHAQPASGRYRVSQPFTAVRWKGCSVDLVTGNRARTW